MKRNKSIFSFCCKGLIIIGLVVAAGYFLLSESNQISLGSFPYLILLACPLIHFFMHRGHGKHHHSNDSPPADSESTDQAYQRGLDEGKQQSDQAKD